MIQIETSHGSGPIRFKQRTNFRLRQLQSFYFSDFLIFSVCRSFDFLKEFLIREIVEHAVPFDSQYDSCWIVEHLSIHGYLNFHSDFGLMNKFYN